MFLIAGMYSVVIAQENNSENNSPYTLTEIFRIGDESSEDSVFITNHEATSIAVNSANQIFIGGGWPPVSPVMSFSSEGHFIGFVGAKGRGPGEFRQSDSVIIGPKDSIYVYDSELDLLLVFEQNTLQYASSMSLLNSESPAGPKKLLGVTDNSYVFWYSQPYCPPVNPVCGYSRNEARFDSVNLVSRRGTLAKLSIARLPAKEYVVRTTRSSISTMPLPFGRDPFFVYKNGLLYAGWNNEIDIKVVSENGEVMRTIKRRHSPVSVTQKERTELISYRSRRDQRTILRSELLSETKPAYDALVVDDNGHVWIREYPRGINSEFANWLILDSDSQLIGEMELPVNVLLKEITRGRAYASVNSEMYGPYIIVYSVTEK